ncbi:alpha/beta fold hydrolase [Brevibacillus porteri]|uniref:Pimeloyl-CoA synthetase n=1 Tax=Brevibacillus porteri TaxID=2126350 RepID=A0ABX5FUR3_9BACL|nr:alpha/beta fold hydrolase [Brevibacillus porteri]MED1798097.1 alpha/beta fold hydrolase [Brevibacillus porteri]MED2132068.1 alpha/beta fold hydrolase [Brevibacillus porteri]MED2742631.1 alpha/beta fold hydrolase [Brevibacillus porteri]MED2814107.1 alpha/beta fold hydrolase [Brevibacillus porteri]MED2893668.1 alpha/beta fold hydrolase [Brevibacillus porteri]
MENKQAIQTGFLEANRARIYYEVVGEGEPLLLIHGFNLDTRLWDAQLQAFAQTYKVVRFDIRGFGKTLATDVPFTLYDDVKAVLLGLGIEKAHVAGLSFGGMVAQEFALAYPQMVSSLILVASGLFGHPRSEQRLHDVERFNQVCQRGTTEEALEMTTQMWFDGPGQPVNEQTVEARNRFKEINRHAFSLPEFGVGLETLSPSPIERLEEIKAPTLVIAGARDYPDFLQIADVLTERITGAQKVILPDSAHIPPMDQPEVFNKLVLEFLAQSMVRSS